MFYVFSKSYSTSFNTQYRINTKFHQFSNLKSFRTVYSSSRGPPWGDPHSKDQATSAASGALEGASCKIFVKYVYYLQTIETIFLRSLLCLYNSCDLCVDDFATLKQIDFIAKASTHRCVHLRCPSEYTILLLASESIKPQAKATLKRPDHHTVAWRLVQVFTAGVYFSSSCLGVVSKYGSSPSSLNCQLHPMNTWNRMSMDHNCQEPLHFARKWDVLTFWRPKSRSKSLRRVKLVRTGIIQHGAQSPNVIWFRRPKDCHCRFYKKRKLLGQLLSRKQLQLMSSWQRRRSIN